MHFSKQFLLFGVEKNNLVNTLVLSLALRISTHFSYRHLRELNSFLVYFYNIRNCVPEFQKDFTSVESDQDKMQQYEVVGVMMLFPFFYCFHFRFHYNCFYL